MIARRLQRQLAQAAQRLVGAAQVEKGMRLQRVGQGLVGLAQAAAAGVMDGLGRPSGPDQGMGGSQCISQVGVQGAGLLEGHGR